MKIKNDLMQTLAGLGLFVLVAAVFYPVFLLKPSTVSSIEIRPFRFKEIQIILVKVHR